MKPGDRVLVSKFKHSTRANKYGSRTLKETYEKEGLLETIAGDYCFVRIQTPLGLDLIKVKTEKVRKSESETMNTIYTLGEEKKQ